jgi:hypothetical protein
VEAMGLCDESDALSSTWTLKAGPAQDFDEIESGMHELGQSRISKSGSGINHMQVYSLQDSGTQWSCRH